MILKYNLNLPYQCHLIINTSADLTKEERNDLSIQENNTTSFVRVSVFYGIDNYFNKDWLVPICEIQSALYSSHLHVENIHEGSISALDEARIDELVSYEYSGFEKIQADIQKVEFEDLEQFPKNPYKHKQK